MRIPSDLDLFRDMIIDLSSSILEIPFGTEGWQDHYFIAAQKASEYKAMAERVVNGAYKSRLFDSSLSEVECSEVQLEVTELKSPSLMTVWCIVGDSLNEYLNGHQSASDC